MSVKLIGKHEKDSRAYRDALALPLNEMMAEDKSICYVDCDLTGCINTKQLLKNYPDRALEAGIAEGNAPVLPPVWPPPEKRYSSIPSDPFPPAAVMTRFICPLPIPD